jgi:hypothetical protein
MAVYRTDLGCCPGRDANDANPSPPLAGGEGLDFDWDSDHTHDY